MEPKAQDYIAALEAQRNAALNEVVNLRAEVAALWREIEALRSKVTAGASGEVADRA